MTTRLTVYGRLTAAEDRTLRGTLVPFGRPGQTNMGRVVVPDASHITVPDDVAGLFASLDHLDGRDPVADWTGIEATAEGYVATWRARDTHGGDKLLAEYLDGTRRGVSMELEPVTITDGVASGTLIGCAFPVRPAFAEARLVAELAPDTEPADLEAAARVAALAQNLYYTAGPAPAGDAPAWDNLADETKAPYLEAALTAVAALAAVPLTAADAGPAFTPEQLERIAAAVRAGNPDATEDEVAAAVANLTAPPPAHRRDPETPDAAGAVDTPPAEQDENMTTPATAPAALLAGARTPAPATNPGPTGPARLLAADAGPSDVWRLLASFGDQTGRMLAALADIVPSNTLDRNQPQWLGEVWSGNAYQRRVVPLLTTGELTDLNVKGWKWTTKPAMAKYTGNKTAVPSNTVQTEPYTDVAQRFAGAHDIDIKYKHFNDTAFFEAYFQAMSESYAKLTDAYAVEELKAVASATTLGTVPSGVPAGWAAIVDMALDVIDVGTPTFALVEKTVYRDMFLTGQDKFLEFLNASMGFEEGQLNGFRIIPVASTAVGTAASTIGLDRGEIIVGTKAAVKFRELGGGTPIRVDAYNLANGGWDEGVFGYAACSIEDVRGVRKVDLTADV